jgi:hypothetical protein
MPGIAFGMFTVDVIDGSGEHINQQQLNTREYETEKTNSTDEHCSCSDRNTVPEQLP